MISKKIFSKNQNFLDNVAVNKTLNKDIFEKSYIRGSLMSSESHLIIDNSSSFFSATVQNLNAVYGNSSVKQVDGSSLSMKSFFYKNKLNNNLKFRSYLLNSVRYKDLLDSFYISLKLLEVSEKKKSLNLVILKPIKGGFICYSSGVSGFLPHSHGVFLLIKTMMAISKDKQLQRRFFNLISLIKGQNSKKVSFPLRLEPSFCKISIYPEFKRNNLSLAPLKKKRDFLNDYNFIFLSQKSQEIKPLKKINLLLNAKIKKIYKR